MTKIQVQLNIRSKSFVEISNMLLEGVNWDIEGDNQNIELQRRVFVAYIQQALLEAPLNDFFFSTVDEEGNIRDAI